MDNQRINIWERKLLDLTMGNALGVQGLKNFLYYAENGTLPEEPEITRMEIVNPL